MINMVFSQWHKRIKWKLGFTSLHIEENLNKNILSFREIPI